MKLVIVEKSSVAQSIARVIGAAGCKDGSHSDSFSYTILPVFLNFIGGVFPLVFFFILLRLILGSGQLSSTLSKRTVLVY